MNKRGYTLLEILMVIAIIAVLGISATVNLSKTIENSKQDRFDEMIVDIKEATNAYMTIYSEIEPPLYTSGSLTVTILELQDALLIDYPLKNPVDNSEIDGNNSNVTITYDSITSSISYIVNIQDTNGNLTTCDNDNNCQNN